MSVPIETTYFLAGSCDPFGMVQNPGDTPFSVWRHGPRGVHYWAPEGQQWNKPVSGFTTSRADLINDLLASGAWVREISGAELPRDVPNYDRARFGS